MSRETMNEQQLKLVSNMMTLQSKFNVKLLPDWKTNPPNYADAIWTEAAEGFDHTAWPWWKKAGQEIDYGQIKMELIDIWHFLMSEIMIHDETEGQTHLDFIKLVYDTTIESIPTLTPPIEEIRESFRLIVRAAILPLTEARIVFITAAFSRAMESIGMDWEEVYKLYVGKNTLNSFRQSNGYKSNTQGYKEIWASEKGWEDNQYLTKILLETTIDYEESVDELQVKLIDILSETFEGLISTKKP